MNKHLVLAVVMALSFTALGCKKKGGSADCDKAIDHSMELSKAEMSKMPGNDAAMMQKMRDLGLQHCKDDKWPDAALTCMVDAKTMADSQACYGKLSQEQQDKMNKAAMELAMPKGPAGSGAEAGSGDMAGSDTGSAAAEGGSAAGSAAAGSAGSGAGGTGSGSAGSAAGK